MNSSRITPTYYYRHKPDLVYSDMGLLQSTGIKDGFLRAPMNWLHFPPFLCDYKRCKLTESQTEHGTEKVLRPVVSTIIRPYDEGYHKITGHHSLGLPNASDAQVLLAVIKAMADMFLMGAVECRKNCKDNIIDNDELAFDIDPKTFVKTYCHRTCKANVIGSIQNSLRRMHGSLITKVQTCKQEKQTGGMLKLRQVTSITTNFISHFDTNPDGTWNIGIRKSLYAVSISDKSLTVPKSLIALPADRPLAILLGLSICSHSAPKRKSGYIVGYEVLRKAAGLRTVDSSLLEGLTPEEKDARLQKRMFRIKQSIDAALDYLMKKKIIRRWEHRKKVGKTWEQVCIWR